MVFLGFFFCFFFYPNHIFPLFASIFFLCLLIYNSNSIRSDFCWSCWKNIYSTKGHLQMKFLSPTFTSIQRNHKWHSLIHTMDAPAEGAKTNDANIPSIGEVKQEPRDNKQSAHIWKSSAPKTLPNCITQALYNYVFFFLIQWCGFLVGDAKKRMGGQTDDPRWICLTGQGIISISTVRGFSVR